MMLGLTGTVCIADSWENDFCATRVLCHPCKAMKCVSASMATMSGIVKCIVLLALVFCISPASAQTITNPIAALKNHITGVAPLTAAQIVTQDNSIQTNIRQVGTNEIALAAALDLVDTYDTTIGALFTTADTKNGFTRDRTAFELEQALFDLQQGLIDYAYKSENLVTYFDLLNPRMWRSSNPASALGRYLASAP
jgi:hypothetical protein